jgi:hypothetical protein
MSNLGKKFILYIPLQEYSLYGIFYSERYCLIHKRRYSLNAMNLIVLNPLAEPIRFQIVDFRYLQDLHK